MVCPVAPRSQTVALVACLKYENVLNILKLAKKQLGDHISAIEYLDATSYGCVVRELKRSNPFEREYPFYMIIETSSSSDSSRAALEDLLAEELSE